MDGQGGRERRRARSPAGTGKEGSECRKGAGRPRGKPADVSGEPSPAIGHPDPQRDRGPEDPRPLTRCSPAQQVDLHPGRRGPAGEEFAQDPPVVGFRCMSSSVGWSRRQTEPQLELGPALGGLVREGRVSRLTVGPFYRSDGGPLGRRFVQLPEGAVPTRPAGMRPRESRRRANPHSLGAGLGTEVTRSAGRIRTAPQLSAQAARKAPSLVSPGTNSFTSRRSRCWKTDAGAGNCWKAAERSSAAGLSTTPIPECP